MRELLTQLEQKIGYRFHDEKLLERAVTHSSYANEHRHGAMGDNERLEFLGDAVLELASSVYLYESYKDMAEGDMTKLRASLVCEPTLAMSARSIGLDECILLGKGEELTGGRGRNSIVSDALEALIGAIYLDGGFACADLFIRKFILNDIEHKKLFHDSKTILQEIVQRDHKGAEIRYELTGEEGPDHRKLFHVKLMIGKEAFAKGSGGTKKAAEQEAAYQTLLMLDKGKRE